MTEFAPLHLIAEDEDDLKIISAAVQDSVLRMGDISFDSRQRRFMLSVNRFRWEADGAERNRHERARSALSFDGVLAARVRGLPKTDREMIVSLLSITFTPDEIAPAGRVKLLFAGDGEIALDVECLDAMLNDLGAVWPTRRKPDHERTRKKG